MDFLGHIIGKRYKVEEQLGGGGMALVYRAHDNFLNREVTLKILRPQYTCDEDFVERFRREAQAVASLSNINTVSVFDVGEENGIHYIVMEYIEGQNLKELIREKGKLTLAEAVDYARQICDGLDHAHEKGIVHRDIKPHNILVTKNGRVKVTDFGIAKAVTSATVTHVGTIIGSVHYLAPEQAKGQPGGIRSDLYSVGVVLYEMVTGQLPFEGETPIAMAMKHIQEEPVAPACLNPEVSPELERVILRSMAKSPEHRYQTAKEMSDDLRTVLAGRISEATRVIPLSDCPTMILPVVEDQAALAKKQAQKKRRWLISIAVLIVLGLIGGAALGIGEMFFNQIVQVPNLIGLTEQEARAQLTEKNLVLKVVDSQNSDKPVGQIFHQLPEADSSVRETRVIKVYISLGPKMYPVPDLKGRTLEEAKALIVQSQMVLGGESYQFDEKVPAGSIASQYPDPADVKEQPQGTKINLVTSKGPEPQYIAIPDVVGLSEQEATDKLAAANLNLLKEAEVESLQYFAGAVVSQNPAPAPEQTIPEGSTINVQISKGPGPTARDFVLRTELPNNGQVNLVKVIIYDAKNPEGRIEYEQQYEGGATIKIPVKVYGKGGKYELFVNNILEQQEEIPD